MSLANFKFRRGVWDIEIDGRGPFVKRFEVDGEKIRGL